MGTRSSHSSKAILVTGVAGTGKSALCKEFKKQGFKAFDIENIEGLFEMIDKRTGKPFEDYDNYDFEKVKQADWICDVNKLKQIISKNRESVAFYCGVASNLDDILPLFDNVFVLYVGEKELRRRLSTRTSNDFGRIKEVQDWIFTWKDWWEDKMKQKGAILINAERPISEVAKDIIRRVVNGKRD